MDDKLYKLLVRTATIMAIAWIGWTMFDSTSVESSDEQELAAAARYIEDGQFNDALQIYNTMLSVNPNDSSALYGKAFTHMQMGLTQLKAQPTEPDKVQLHTALEYFDLAISAEQQKAKEHNNTLLGVSFANRGIVKDRLEDHAGALADYRQAIALEPDVAEGPGWLTRFFRNQVTAPPTVADRADYLAKQLQLPKTERQLSLPELDNQQRSYKM